MSPDELLQLIVEASLAVAGFAGIVNVLSARDASGATRTLRRMNMVNLLGTAFCALFLSLGALAMLVAGVEESLVWRVLSGLGLLINLFFAWRSIRIVSSASRGPTPRTTGILLAINLPLSVVLGFQIWNILVAGEFWPFFLLLAADFVIGCLSFARLLVEARGREPT